MLTTNQYTIHSHRSISPPHVKSTWSSIVRIKATSKIQLDGRVNRAHNHMWYVHPPTSVCLCNEILPFFSRICFAACKITICFLLYLLFGVNCQSEFRVEWRNRNGKIFFIQTWILLNFEICMNFRIFRLNARATFRTWRQQIVYFIRHCFFRDHLENIHVHLKILLIFISHFDYERQMMNNESNFSKNRKKYFVQIFKSFFRWKMHWILCQISMLAEAAMFYCIASLHLNGHFRYYVAVSCE